MKTCIVLYKMHCEAVSVLGWEFTEWVGVPHSLGRKGLDKAPRACMNKNHASK